MDNVSVVIPVYNSEKTIGSVVEEVITELTRMKVTEYEIILVNDGSRDNVLNVIKSLAEQNNAIKVIDLVRNSGQTNALLCGYSYATGDYIVNMDDDMQTPGYEIGKMARAMEEQDCDVVFARYPDQKQKKWRRIGSNLNYKMAEIMTGKPKGLRTNSFFIMRRFVCDGILKYDGRNTYIFGVIFAITQKVINVDVDHRERAEGRSGWSLKMLFSLWLDGFLDFSVIPLRIASVSGAVVVAGTILYAIYVIIAKLLAPDQNMGWTSLILAIMFFSGVQLISMGIIGEYVGRVFQNSSKLPKYTVRSTSNINDLKKTENNNNV